ncbi:MAG: type II toxin-antitoxin system HicA family toxin [Candidatus Bipolaricaulota bacterium]|nr:type II toxin-antitoxin system HicA family toxin [Candidatus Bipolaricaulota bacterium]
MASYKFDDFRRVLERAGFTKIPGRKHETWRKVLADGTILRVRLSYQHGRDIPRWLFYEMLRQAGLDEATFRKLLGRH